LTPFKAIPEAFIANYSLFTHRKISQFPGHKKEIYGVPLPARIEHVVKTARVISDTDRVFKFFFRGDSKQDKSFSLAFSRFLLGLKSYPHDPERQKRRWDLESRKIIGMLKSKKGYFERIKQTRNAENIQKTIDKWEQLRKEHLKP
jgi:hypothetical protein